MFSFFVVVVSVEHIASLTAIEKHKYFDDKS